MGLERKDLRLKLDPDDHMGLTLLADADECDLAEWAERVLVRAIRRRIHAAQRIADRAAKLGIAGKAIPGDD